MCFFSGSLCAVCGSCIFWGLLCRTCMRVCVVCMHEIIVLAHPRTPLRDRLGWLGVRKQVPGTTTVMSDRAAVSTTAFESVRNLPKYDMVCFAFTTAVLRACVAYHIMHTTYEYPRVCSITYIIHTCLKIFYPWAKITQRVYGVWRMYIYMYVCVFFC